jgi:hypothetical protein
MDFDFMTIIPQAGAEPQVSFHPSIDAALQSASLQPKGAQVYELSQGGYRLRHIINSAEAASFLLGRPALRLAS